MPGTFFYPERRTGTTGEKKPRPGNRTPKTSRAVWIERCGQRAGKLAQALNKHAVAVSRWASEAALERQSNPSFDKALLLFDEELSNWSLSVLARDEPEAKDTVQ